MEGKPYHIQGAALPISNTSSTSLLLSEALPEYCSSINTTPSCCCWTESSPTSPSLLAGSRRERRHRAVHVLNAEVPLFGAWIGWIVKTFDYIKCVN